MRECGSRPDFCFANSEIGDYLPIERHAQLGARMQFLLNLLFEKVLYGLKRRAEYWFG